VTSKLNIIPLSVCSAMWQCAIHSPGLETNSRRSTVSPDRIICLLLLLLLLPVCGMHIAGAHHDSHLDSLGVAEASQATRDIPQILPIHAWIAAAFLLIAAGATHSVGSLFATRGPPLSTSSLHLPLRR
jgi:hypothetical protein